MKKSLTLLAGLTIALSVPAGFAEELPAAPEMSFVQPSAAAQKPASPLKRISWVEYSLYSGVLATHAADWATTERCVHLSQEQERAGSIGLCHEALLPSALVDSKMGLVAYESTTAGLEIYSEYVLTRNHHRRMARVAQLANIAGTAYVVAHNYHTIQVAAHP